MNQQASDDDQHRLSMTTTLYQEGRPTISVAGEAGSRCPEELLSRYGEIVEGGMPHEVVAGGFGCRELRGERLNGGLLAGGEFGGTFRFRVNGMGARAWGDRRWNLSGVR